MNKNSKNSKNSDIQETPAEEEETPKPVWEQGGATHGHSSYNLYGVNGLIREKGCREIGGLQVRIYRTENADEPICNRASADEKYTVVITGTHEGGQGDLDVSRLQKHGTKSRADAMKAARHPSGWSKKAQTIVDKMEAEAKAKAEEAEAKAEAKEAEATAKAET